MKLPDNLPKLAWTNGTQKSTNVCKSSKKSSYWFSHFKVFANLSSDFHIHSSGA